MKVKIDKENNKFDLFKFGITYAMVIFQVFVFITIYKFLQKLSNELNTKQLVVLFILCIPMLIGGIWGFFKFKGLGNDPWLLLVTRVFGIFKGIGVAAFFTFIPLVLMGYALTFSF